MLIAIFKSHDPSRALDPPRNQLYPSRNYTVILTHSVTMLSMTDNSESCESQMCESNLNRPKTYRAIRAVPSVLIAGAIFAQRADSRGEKEKPRKKRTRERETRTEFTHATYRQSGDTAIRR